MGELWLKLLFFCFQGFTACARCSCNIILFIYLYYSLVLCTCRYIPRSTCRFSTRRRVRIFFYFLLWTPRVRPCAGRVRVGAIYSACVCAYILFFNIIIFIYIYLYNPICACVGEFFVLIFENVCDVGGSATPGCTADRLENLEKHPHRHTLTASPTKNRRKSRI